MNDIFSDLINISVIIYLDDILIYSSDLASHKEHVKEVLLHLRKHGLYAWPDKCEWHADRVEYLGYILLADGLSMAADKKGVPFKFSDEAWELFNYLKKAFTTAPVLTQWIPDQPIILETDASNYALAAILSIELTNGEIHLVAFHSRMFNPTKLNYDVHNKELFAIYELFQIWWHYLEGSGTPIDIVTDHKNLEYFATMKLLNCQQARWSEYLSQFNLIIRFRPGKLGAKLDALTRQWDVYLKEGGNDYATVNPHNFCPVFTQEQLAMSLRASTLITPSLHGATTLNIKKLHADIQEALLNDPISAAQLLAPSDPKFTFPLTAYYFSMIISLFQTLTTCGSNKTLKLVRREYAWPSMHDFVKDYVNSCVICNRVKPRCHKPYGLLKQLPVPECPWNSISMDLIEKLLPSAGFTDILVIIDRLTKQAVFMLTHSDLTAVKLAELFILNVFSKHGVPSHVTSDRGSKFVSHFFRGLGKALDIELHFTSGYHPEGDGQTEHTNQTLEQYLRTYCNYQQDNWVTLLLLAEFAYNNAPHDATGVSPFFANKEFTVDLGELHEFLKENIRKSQKRYQKAANNRCLPAPNFKKLAEKFLGPYEIIAQVGSHSFTLCLPQSMRLVHPVFHVSMLEPFKPSTIPNCAVELPAPVKIEGELE
ncbi:unnamed protein product [Cyclocybe aegerita]|uniref:Integrase catalytic domain-containing protein n=1 Tax=Cyclocybe aegerita TaxID=1973307 RepID=A0A8S0W758_CYCAE|nr:unnamed protein product [Cyclocybe aegerita]